MNIKNKIAQNSLRCLQHPATWLSIALLLVNDHFFKVAAPSWITGKLSDFAGLFFFPFIVAACLSFLLSKSTIPIAPIRKLLMGVGKNWGIPVFSNPSPESSDRFLVRFGQIAFGLVGIWFITLKMFPLVNFLTTDLASRLLGYPAKYAMDPTDLVALFAMLPAWAIWRQPSPRKPTSAAYAALFFGSLAVIATSPPNTVSSVTYLEYYQDGIVYAANVFPMSPTSSPIAESFDGGLTWQEATEVVTIEPKSLPMQLCGRLNPEICYRLTRIGVLQIRGPESKWIKVAEVSVKGEDMIFFVWEDKEYVIVAIGEHGIVRRELPDGEWQVITVVYADSPIEDE